MTINPTIWEKLDTLTTAVAQKSGRQAEESKKKKVERIVAFYSQRYRNAPRAVEHNAMAK